MSKKVILKPVIDLITKIFGKNALSKTIGTRTNVITLPDADVKRIIKNELDIAKASDAQLEVFRKRAEQLIPDIPKMNDQELLTFKSNLQRYYNKMYPPSAEVFDFETKRKFSPKGIEQLETEVGMPPDVDVKTSLGRMLQESKFNLKDVGKVLEDIMSGPKKTTEELYEQTRKSIEEPTEAEKAFRAQEKTRIGQVFDETAQAQSSYIKMQNEGLVRATAREIMERDIKSGKLQIPKEEMQVITEYSSVNDPIDIWRKYYGEDALEQLDSMVPDFYNMRTSREAADAATKKFNFEPKLDRPVGSFDPDKPPEFADGGRVGFANGGTYDRYMANLAEIQSRAKADPLASLVANPSPEMTDGDSVSGAVTRGSVTRGNTTVQSPLGFADVMSLTNPVSAIANMASRAMTGRSISENARRGINSVAAAMGFGSIGSTPGAEDNGGAGSGNSAASSDPDSQGDTGAATGGDGGGVGSSSDAGAGSTGSCGSFRDGGMVGQSARVHASMGLVKGMIDWLVKNRNFAKELLDRVSKQKNGEKLIKELYEAETKKTGASPVTMGEAPKTDLKKVRDKAETDKKITAELAKDKQIPVKDQTEQKTKTIKKILTEDDLRALGKKEGIPEQDVEKFLSGELGLLRRDQARGVVQRDKEGNIVIKDKYSKKYDPLRENPVFKDETIIPQDVITVPEPFKGKYQQEFLAHDALYGRRSGDNKVDAEAIAETVADMQGKVYDDLGYTERMDLYDKAYGYLSLLDRTTGAMKEASNLQKSGRQLNAGGGLAYLMGL